MESSASAADDLLFLDEGTTCADADTPSPWRVLVVDDDPDVHEVTRFALAGLSILDRPLELLHAHSGKEGLAALRRETGIAIVLLDVVMETDDAGLRVVDAIRNELGMRNVRIILRTGQPGQAPETETITRYDINDYKTKSELSQARLFATLTTAVRSYDQLQRLDSSRRGLEMIVAASNQLNAKQGVQAFAEGLITQIAALIGVAAEGLVCAIDSASGDAAAPREYQVVAAAGRLGHLMQHRLDEIDDVRIAGALTEALRTRASIVGRKHLTLYFAKSESEGFAAFVDSAHPLREIDRHLIEVFCTNIALCAKNVDLVSELRRDAFFDRQIGMPNRTALIGEINARIAADPDADFALAIIDVDQFATVNDILGQHYGDALLKATGTRLREFFAGAECFVARLAGDAFAVVAPRAALDPDTVRRCFAAPFVIDGIQHPVSASAGLVYNDGHIGSGGECVRDGYLALKRAKAGGLAQVVVHCPTLATEFRSRALLLHELRAAFEAGDLFLAYQPQIDLVSGRVIGAEALLRWRRDDGTLIPPDRFIPLAEQSGLIIEIGRWLLREALLAMQRFRAAGNPALRMAVNVSPVQLRQPDFATTVLATLRETGSPPAALEVEITESVAVGGLEPAVAMLNELRRHGITVAIDDFGTGYSSLSYLQKLPADRLKIDRSFVVALERDGHGARITRTIVVLGRELGLKIIAEGVEGPSLASMTLELGCDEAQGYHYGRPMGADEFIAWMGRQE